MGLRFHHKINILPGVSINVGLRSASISVGVPGAHLNLSPTRGLSTTLGIPGTGLSYRQSLNGLFDKSTPHSPSIPHQPRIVPGQSREFDYGIEVGSASVSQLAEGGLQDLHEYIKQAHTDFSDKENTLTTSNELLKAAIKHQKKRAFWFGRLLFKDTMAALDQKVLDMTNDQATAQAAFDAAGMVFDWSMDADLMNQYARLVIAFQKAKSSQHIWRITKRLANTLRTHNRAVNHIERTLVTDVGEDRPAYLPATEHDPFQTVPMITGATGAKLYFFPAFLFIEDSADFAVYDYTSVSIVGTSINFVEHDGLPSDATQVGTTYQYLNKNGQPDRRRSYNPTVPIAEYGVLKIFSTTGLDEEFQFSSISKFNEFRDAMNLFRAMFIAKSGNK
jgi:Protein of unknown function (DUF4236)